MKNDFTPEEQAVIHKAGAYFGAMGGASTSKKKIDACKRTLAAINKRRKAAAKRKAARAARKRNRK